MSPEIEHQHQLAERRHGAKGGPPVGHVGDQGAQGHPEDGGGGDTAEDDGGRQALLRLRNEARSQAPGDGPHAAHAKTD